MPLEASASAACAAAGVWLLAECKHSVLQEFTPETAAACPHASLMGKLEPQLEAVHGSAQSPIGAGKISLVSSRCLQACSGQCQPQKRPRWNHVRCSECNSAIMMMVAPENDGGLLRSPESSPLESQSFARSGKQLLSGLTFCEGHQ